MQNLKKLDWKIRACATNALRGRGEEESRVDRPSSMAKNVKSF